MKKYPLVSIIIVNWNGGDVFADCLGSLAKLKYPNWELIVVDNGSTDGSEKLPDKYFTNHQSLITNYLLIKNQQNLGFASANNQGYKKAKGKYILLLNNDTKVTPAFLTKLVNRMEEDLSIGVIQPKIFMMDKPGYLDNAGSFMTRIGFLEHWGFGNKDSKEFNKECEVFSCKGACMLIRRSVVEKVGLFDDDFISYFEESDFCWRVWLIGLKVIFYPESHIYHKVGFTLQRLDITKINFDYYKNRIAAMIKNLELKNIFMILPVHIFISVGISIVFAFRGQFKGSAMIIGAIVWNVRNIKITLSKRKEILSLRKVSDDELFDGLSKRVNWGKFLGDFKRVEKDLSS